MHAHSTHIGPVIAASVPRQCQSLRCNGARLHGRRAPWPPQVVCEESSNDYTYGVKKPRKERYPAGFVTPASPDYVHGCMDSEQVRAQCVPWR